MRVIFIVAIGKSDCVQYCLNTWNWWASRNNARVELLTERLGPHSPAFHKLQVFEVLQRRGLAAEQVAVVDYDTMIRWDCPDFFNLSGSRFSAVPDLGNIEWILESCQACQPYFPGVQVNWEEYFNTGFLVLTHQHRMLLKETFDFAIRHGAADAPNVCGIAGGEQTVLNYMARQMKLDLQLLPLGYNLTKLKRRGCWPHGWQAAGYIWHFNGDHWGTRPRGMAKAWQMIRHRYPQVQPAAA